MNNENVNEQELTAEEVNKLVEVRIQKLKELQEKGKNPFATLLYHTFFSLYSV